MQSSDIPEAFYSPETPYSAPEASLENNEPQPGHSPTAISAPVVVGEEVESSANMQAWDEKMRKMREE